MRHSYFSPAGTGFLGDEDRDLFLATLGESCGKSGWQVHALCLMNNHFHLVVETPRANLIAWMRWFLGTGMEQSEFGLAEIEVGLVLGVKEFSGGEARIDWRAARQPASRGGVEGIG